MSTEHIPEATLVEETTTTAETTSTNTTESLHDRLKLSTETKIPGANPVKTETKKSFWEETDSDFEKEEKPEPTAKAATTTKGTDPVTDPKKTDKIKHAEADMAVGLLNVTVIGAFVPLQNVKLKRKLKKKFNETEQDLLNNKNLADIDLVDISDVEELKVKKRIDAIMKKYNKKVDAVPLNEKEKEQFHQACYNYQEITGKSLPPGLFLGLSALQIFSNRVIDLATD